jgi:hypothetical protein
MSNPAKNDTLLTPDDHALLMIDHQYLQLHGPTYAHVITTTAELLASMAGEARAA